MVVKFKLLTSFIFSIIATVFYLIVTNFMDTIMSPKMSNMIGLLLDFTLDYMVQSKIFLDKIHFNKTQVGKAIKLHKSFISRKDDIWCVISVGIRQKIFDFVRFI